MMNLTRRFHQRLVRWTSLCVCFALVLSCLAIIPFASVTGKNRYGTARGSERVTRAGDAKRGSSPTAREGSATTRGARQGNGQSRRVNPPTPFAGPPAGIVPNLDYMKRISDQDRRNGGRRVHAPDPVPSTGKRWRHGLNLLRVSSSTTARRGVKAHHARSRLSIAPTMTEGAIADGASAPPPPPQGYYNPAMARIDPHNRTGTGGVDPLSNNFNWSLGLVGLKGRGGLDLGLSLSYNSLVWTRSGNYVDFDLDQGSIAPGFRLGFPTVEGPYWNDQVNAYFYLMVTPSGARIELRDTGTANTYESADSYHLQLQITDSTHALVRPTDGTRMSFTLGSHGWRCNEIKDRNGNYLTITHNNAGDLLSVIDTLNRTISVTYDGNGNIQTVDQTWNGQVHHWAVFGWNMANIGHNFAGLINNGPDNTVVSVINMVGLADGSFYTFEYNNTYGQVSTIRYYASDGHERRHVSYDLPANSSDCPRVTAEHVWAEVWNGINGVPADVVTYFGHDGDGGCRVTFPDGTVDKEYYGTGWQSGLTIETRSFATTSDADNYYWKKRTTTAWTQDNTNVSYPLNPRVIETNIYDSEYHRRRTTIDYGPYAAWSLPNFVVEYDNDGTTQLRHTYVDYNLSQQYLDKRIIGLVSAVHMSNTIWWQSKTTYTYDESAEIQSGSAATVQHDGAYDTSVPRGNVTSVSRWDVTDGNSINDTSKVLTSHVGYDTNGSPVWSSDASGHTSHVYYTDSFSDNTNHNTFAYPTTVNDADGFSSTVQYNFDFGAVTHTQGPPPAGQSAGASQNLYYDDAGRLQWVTRPDGFWHYFWYAPRGDAVVEQVSLTQAPESRWSITVVDGADRTRLVGHDLPNSTGGYAGAFTYYDNMGRPNQQSNVEETNGIWVPVGDDAAGWSWASQTYDWKGRPLVTTNQDNTTTSASYGGCGCAGGEVVTLTDEAGRSHRITSDVLGRQGKTEQLNWDGTVYSTANFSYNALDQLTNINYEGQIRSFLYDGYGRLQSRTTPEQGTSTYSYFSDGTMQTVTDARGASSTFAYNGRHLVTSISYRVPAGVTATSNISLGYDAAGNRVSMNDGLGSVSYFYNQLSEMTSETRSFSGLGSYSLSYSYNLAGELTSITNPWNAQVTYSYDSSGRLANVGGANYGGVSSYANSLSYRAFGGVKAANYGDGHSLSAAYDNQMRTTTWNVSGVLGYNYNYDYFNEHTGRVTYAQSIYDSTLDRSYQYDHVGALTNAHSGAEARAHIGQGSWGTSDGPYSQVYAYDKFGNMTQRTGWGGEVQGGSPAMPTDIHYNYTNNRRNDFTYDAAGNLTQDDKYSYAYDATGQQTNTGGIRYFMSQSYDGDGLRGFTEENEFDTYYLRSSVLGGTVVAELNGAGTLKHGYVYAGSQLVATQQNGQVNWVDEDAITKSQRITDVNGNVIANGVVELDPWGANTNRSSGGSAFQPHQISGYTRDSNGGEDAMARRYSVTGRFSQPDPYEGSYDGSDPQSLNRYAYVGNDPVNRRDPTGLLESWNCPAMYSSCYGNGGGGYSGTPSDSGSYYMGGYNDIPRGIVQGLRQHDERVSNAIGGNGFRTNAEVTREFEIRYGYNEDGSLWTSFSIRVDVGFDDPIARMLSIGARDSWPPDWPMRSNGYDPRFGWKTQPPPEMEQFPEKIGLGPKGAEPQRVFNPDINPSNASRASQLARAIFNAVGKFLGGAVTVIGGTFVDIGGIMLGPSFLLDPCLNNPYDPRCRRGDLEASTRRGSSRRRM